MSDRYDLVIVGGGAAGFTAGIYAARDRCRALLVERFSPGGQVLNIVITYCEECNFTPWATSLRDALQERYGTTATMRDAGNGFFFVDVDGRRIFNNQETYGFPDHEQIFARLDALRDQAR